MRSATSWTVLAVAALALASAHGCASSGAIGVEVKPGLNCIDDSADCIAKRQAALKSMVSDPTKAWINENPTPEAYASGVRLFAFKTKKKELTCEELRRGKIEADAARASLKSAGARITHQQLTRGAMLATEVGRELQNEFAKRCS